MDYCQWEALFLLLKGRRFDSSMELERRDIVSDSTLVNVTSSGLVGFYHPDCNYYSPPKMTALPATKVLTQGDQIQPRVLVRCTKLVLSQESLFWIHTGLKT